MGPVCTKKLFIAHPKLKLNSVSWVLFAKPGNPTCDRFMTQHSVVIFSLHLAVGQTLLFICLFACLMPVCLYRGFSGGSDRKESARNVGDTSSIPGWGRSPGEGEWLTTPSCLENSRDRGAWQATQSMGSKRAGHDWVTNTFTFLYGNIGSVGAGTPSIYLTFCVVPETRTLSNIQ